MPDSVKNQIVSVMFAEGSTDALLYCGNITVSTLDAARVENTIPFSYRLMRLKGTGELVLQGCFQWHQGWESGHEWRDIPTVEEE